MKTINDGLLAHTRAQKEQRMKVATNLHAVLERIDLTSTEVNAKTPIDFNGVESSLT